MRAILCVTCALAFVVIARPSSAQHPTHLWSQRFGSTSDDVGQGVAVDGSGNVFMTGRFIGTVDFGGGGLVSAGFDDIVVAKFSPTGAHLWSQRFGSTGLDRGLAIAVDGSGNVTVTGAFSGTVDFGGGPLVSAGGQDIFVASYDASGAHLWSKHFGDTGDDRGRGIAVDGSGDVLVTGQFAGTVDFGGGNLVSSVGSDDIFLAKYDSSGAHVWSKRFGSSNQDIGFAVAVDGSGNAVLTGFFRGAVNFGGGNLTSAGVEDIFVAKYDATGAHQWSQRFGSTATDVGNGVALDASGNVFLTGYFFNTVDFGGGGLISSSGSRDIFLAKYDATGAHQWSQRFGSTGDDQGDAVAVDGSGNVVMTGYFNGTMTFGGGGLVGAGAGDLFLAKFDAAGVHQWSSGFGNTGEDEGQAVAVDGSGNVVMTGRFSFTVNFGGADLTDAGPRDIVLAKYASIATGVNGVPRSYGAAILAYPNPFNPETTIRYTVPSKGRVTVDVFDARGTHVVTLIDADKPAGVYAVTWNGRDDRGAAVSSGVYFARLTSQSGVTSCKLALLK
jgi:FlgD Ig-like domain/Beta-propeller repeat